MAETFAMIPAPPRALWTIAVIGLLLLVLIGVFAYLLYSSQNTRVLITAGGIQIQNSMFGRSIPAAELKPDHARQLNLEHNDGYRPKWRRGGTGLPGYKEGWSSLRNGEKALVFVTDPSRVVYLPTTRDYVLMVSVEDPQRFINSLRETLR